jgi:hypothetical protein
MYTATTDGTSAKPQVFSFYSSPTIVDDAEKPIENLAHFYATSTAPDIVENHYGLYLGVEGGQNVFNIYAASRSPNYFGGDIQVEAQQKIECRTYKGPVSNDAEIKLSGQATLKAGDGSEYVPTDDNSLVTRKYVDDKLENGATQITLPPNTDPATAEPLAIITLVSNQAAYIGAGKIAGYLDPDQVPTRATGAVWQFREDGTSDWFLGTASYIAYPGSTIGGTEKDMGDLQAAVTEAQAMTAEFASNARVKVLLNFGPTNGKSYEVRLAYETAAGVGAWEYDDGRFNPSGY